MTEYEATGIVQGGRLKVRNQRGFEAAMKQFRDGEVAVRIERRRATRSHQANAYYWGVCLELLSEHTGYTADEIHELMKAMFLPKRLAVCDGNGEVKGEYVIGGTTTRLNVNEFYQFIESLRRWAAETLGVVIPDPVS